MGSLRVSASYLSLLSHLLYFYSTRYFLSFESAIVSCLGSSDLLSVRQTTYRIDNRVYDGRGKKASEHRQRKREAKEAEKVEAAPGGDRSKLETF